MEQYKVVIKEIFAAAAEGEPYLDFETFIEFQCGLCEAADASEEIITNMRENHEVVREVWNSLKVNEAAEKIYWDTIWNYFGTMMHSPHANLDDETFDD